jgi:hypothetical protein
MYILALSDNTEQQQRAKRLLAVTQHVDPNRWRAQLREVAFSKSIRDVEELARSAPIEELTPSALGLLGYLVEHQDTASAVILESLRRAQQRFPADFWINHGLAYALSDCPPP